MTAGHHASLRFLDLDDDDESYWSSSIVELAPLRSFLRPFHPRHVLSSSQSSVDSLEDYLRVARLSPTGLETMRLLVATLVGGGTRSFGGSSFGTSGDSQRKKG